MSSKTALVLCQWRIGRCLVHLACARRDHRWHWHIAGIIRDLLGH